MSFRSISLVQSESKVSTIGKQAPDSISLCAQLGVTHVTLTFAQLSKAQFWAHNEEGTTRGKDFTDQMRRGSVSTQPDEDLAWSGTVLRASCGLCLNSGRSLLCSEVNWPEPLVAVAFSACSDVKGSVFGEPDSGLQKSSLF